jgi:hypothetical protein
MSSVELAKAVDDIQAISIYPAEISGNGSIALDLV